MKNEHDDLRSAAMEASDLLLDASFNIPIDHDRAIQVYRRLWSALIGNQELRLPDDAHKFYEKGERQ